MLENRPSASGKVSIRLDEPSSDVMLECKLSTCRERRKTLPDSCILATAYYGILEMPFTSKRLRAEYKNKFITAYTKGDCLFEPPEHQQARKEDNKPTDQLL